MYTDHIIWWIIPTNNHYGILEEGQIVTSIHTFEQHATEQAWLDRLVKLNIEIEPGLIAPE